jgi:4-amino-4-deoxy-L-arabinose transferase-like glycosyltransferase
VQNELAAPERIPAVSATSRVCAGTPRLFASPLLLSLLALGLFALRLTAPSNFLDQDQERPATYVLDVIKNASWVCQHDLLGEITSKPPFYTWLCALVALPFGRVNLFALYLPGALAAWGTAMLVFSFARAHFGERAGVLSALAVMLSTAGLKEFGLARTDGVFALTITAAAFLAYLAWTQKRSWVWFWLLSAIATLTKGPLGVVLAAGGLWALLWEWKTNSSRNKNSSLPGVSLHLRPHLIGILVYLFLTFGWFALAYRQLGHPLVQKMFEDELREHAVGGGGHHLPGTLFYQQPLYFLGRGAPWSFFACYALWRVFKHPSLEVSQRRFERFLFCWFVFGLLLFSLAPHQRADLLWPIMPAAALLAGRELARLTFPVSRATFTRCVAALTLVMTSGFAIYYFGPRARQPFVRETVALKSLAAQVKKEAASRLVHTDDPMALQVYLNTWRPRVSMQAAAELLRSTNPCFVAVKSLSKLDAARNSSDIPYYTLLGQPATTHIIGNHPSFSPPATHE